MHKSFLIILLLFLFSESQGQKIHSHNDYLQENAFWEAFNAGAESIEADVFLVSGKLYVAHQKHEIKLTNTFDRMYLQPLMKIVDRKKRQNLQILIDVKTDAYETLELIMKEINAYPKLAKAFSKKRQIKFVISGKRPPIDTYADYPDFIFFDHQSLLDLPQKAHSKVAMVSFSFGTYWKRNEEGLIIQSDLLKSVIDTVHTLGYPIRFWATPDNPLTWKTLCDLGVDFINTDKPRLCREYIHP